MGHGSYKASDWAKLKQSRGITSSSNVQQIFSHNSIKDKYNPKFINMRESRDSEDSPLSTPIIIGFDVTGSMGYLAEEIAKNALDKTITEIYNKQPVTNPHIMCAAITEPEPDTGLQVTQFEADIRVMEQLLELKVAFGGNWYSADSLVWYFAAAHTSIDCFEKRGKKGFLFVIGDEICGASKGERLGITEIRTIFNDRLKKSFSLKELADMAMEKYEVFHIVMDNRPNDTVFKTWEKFLPGRVALLNEKDVKYISEVIITLMQLTNGMPRETVMNQWPADVRRIVEKATETIRFDGPAPDDPDKKEKGGFFERLFS